MPQVHQPPVPGTKGGGEAVPGATLAEKATGATPRPPTRAATAAATGKLRPRPVTRALLIEPTTEKATGVTLPPRLAIQVLTAPWPVRVLRTKAAARPQTVHTDLLPIRSTMNNVPAVGHTLKQPQLLLSAKAAPNGLATAVASNATRNAIATRHPPEGDAKATSVRVPQATPTPGRAGDAPNTAGLLVQGVSPATPAVSVGPKRNAADTIAISDRRGSGGGLLPLTRFPAVGGLALALLVGVVPLGAGGRQYAKLKLYRQLRPRLLRRLPLVLAAVRLPLEPGGPRVGPPLGAERVARRPPRRLLPLLLGPLLPLAPLPLRGLLPNLPRPHRRKLRVVAQLKLQTERHKEGLVNSAGLVLKPPTAQRAVKVAHLLPDPLPAANLHGAGQHMRRKEPLLGKDVGA